MVEELSLLVTRRRQTTLAGDLQKGKLDLAKDETLNADSRLHRVAAGLTVPP